MKALDVTRVSSRHKVDVLVILETRVKVNNAKKINKQLGDG